MTRVEIDAAGRRVAVRHNGDLTEAVDAAIRAWRSLGDQAPPDGADPLRLGPVGFSAALELAPAADDDERITVR